MFSTKYHNSDHLFTKSKIGLFWSAIYCGTTILQRWMQADGNWLIFMWIEPQLNTYGCLNKKKKPKKWSRCNLHTNKLCTRWSKQKVPARCRHLRLALNTTHAVISPSFNKFAKWLDTIILSIWFSKGAGRAGDYRCHHCAPHLY